MPEQSLDSVLKELIIRRAKAVKTLEAINSDIAAVNAAIGVAKRYVNSETEDEAPAEASATREDDKSEPVGVSPEIDIQIVRKEPQPSTTKVVLTEQLLSAISAGSRISKAELLDKLLQCNPPMIRRTFTDTSYKLIGQGRLATDGEFYWIPEKSDKPKAKAPDSKPMLADAVLATVTDKPTLKHTLVKAVLASNSALKRESVIATIHKLARQGKIFNEGDKYCKIAFSEKKLHETPIVLEPPIQKPEAVSAPEPVSAIKPEPKPKPHRAIMEDIPAYVPRPVAVPTGVIEDLVFEVLETNPRIEQPKLIDKVVARNSNLTRSVVSSVIFSMLKDVKIRKSSAPNFTIYIEAYLKPALPA